MNVLSSSTAPIWGRSSGWGFLPPGEPELPVLRGQSPAAEPRPAPADDQAAEGLLAARALPGALGLKRAACPAAESAEEDSALAPAEPGKAPEEADGAPGTAEKGEQTEDAEERGGLKQLSSEEERVVMEMRGRDQEVRRHEQAHMAAGGGVTQGGPQYEYQTGPDGKRYAVGGHVNIQAGGGDTPEEKIAQAEKVRRAALAPAEPSGQDRAVAAQAAQDAASARQELAKERTEERKDPAESAAPDDGPATDETSAGTETSPEASATSSMPEEDGPAADLVSRARAAYQAQSAQLSKAASFQATA